MKKIKILIEILISLSCLAWNHLPPGFLLYEKNKHLFKSLLLTAKSDPNTTSKLFQCVHLLTQAFIYLISKYH